MTTPDLTKYDVIAVSSSAGKDSQAMLHFVTELAREAGVADRIVVIHADLGKIEWPGTLELAREQAEEYGHRFEVVTRIGGIASRGGKTYARGEEYGDLLDYAERRGAWPDSKNRWCTSDFKRGPILTCLTALAKEWREANSHEDRPCRILDCMGLRAEESPARAKKPELRQRKSNSNQHIDSWLPIHSWSEQQVWECIHASGVPYHPAYDLGMRRLSCVFCIFATRDDLAIAGAANPDLLREYIALEERIDHTFRHGFSLASLVAEGGDVVEQLALFGG